MKSSSPLQINSNNNERGQSLVEFALILPVLLASMLGILDFGRAFFIYSEVSNSVREAIRYAAVNPYDCNQMKQRAAATLALTDISSINFTITFDRGEITDTFFTYASDCSDDPATIPEVVIGDRVTIRAEMQVNLLVGQIIGPLVQQTAWSSLPVDYTSSRTVVPPEGVATGPTSTPYPTATSIAGTATDTSTPTATLPAPPLTPPDFVATVNCSNKNVSFDWTSVANKDQYDIYQVSGPWQATTTSSKCTNCDNLATSETRSYYVTASNAGGESAPSNISTVVCGSGATDTATHTATPTDTATATNTPTNTAIPTATGSPIPTRTEVPTLTGSESPTPTDTATATPTDTATPSPTIPTGSLNIQFEPGYPARKTSGAPATWMMWVKVRVTDAAGNPVTDATVTIIEPSVTSPTLTHLSNGVYGAGGTCYSSATSSNTTVRVRAERAFYTTAEVSDDTDNQPASDSCP